MAAHHLQRHSVSLLLFTLLPAGLRAQSDTIDIPPSNVVSAQTFTLVRGAQELPDARLLVTDWLEQRLAVIDFDRRTVADRGRTGAGPEEFRLPGLLLPFRGDSSILIDVGNARLAVLDVNGEIRRTSTPGHGVATSPGGADLSGRLYFTVPSWLAERPLAGDSIQLLRTDGIASSAEPVARIRGVSMLTTPSMQPRVPFVIFAPQDSWLATRNGRVVIVRSADYSIEWHDGNGAVRRGAAHAGASRPISLAEKRAYVRRFLAGSPIGGRGSEGLTIAPAETLSDESVDRVVRASTFAGTLPHFNPGELWLDRNERLWVGRSVASHEHRLYDIFDQRGERIATVRLARDRHLLTIGDAHLYVIHTDSDGLQTIERVALPTVTPS
jgi:hypothetical protein